MPDINVVVVESEEVAVSDVATQVIQVTGTEIAVQLTANDFGVGTPVETVAVNALAGQVVYNVQVGEVMEIEETEVSYTKRVDLEDNDTVLYRGEAEPGSLESWAVWRISKTVFNEEGDSEQLWADGNAQFDNIWEDRLNLTYR
jgi:hypothetical protein